MTHPSMANRLAVETPGRHKDDWCGMTEFEVRYAQVGVAELLGLSTAPKHRAEVSG